VAELVELAEQCNLPAEFVVALQPSILPSANPD
jgi:hypothetical protein